MFTGEYQHNLDPKGRLFIPSRLREGLGDLFVLTKGLDNCLFAFPMPEWEVLEQKTKALSFTSRDARTFSRIFFSGAAECEVDKQGRILVPVNLREHAELEKEAVIIGASTRVEIWSSDTWEKYKSKAMPLYEELAEKLFDADFEL